MEAKGSFLYRVRIVILVIIVGFPHITKHEISESIGVSGVKPLEIVIIYLFFFSFLPSSIEFTKPDRLYLDMHICYTFLATTHF